MAFEQTSHSVCLHSSSNRDRFPNNNPAEFVNHFASPIENQERFGYYLSLKSVALSTQCINPPPYVKIKIYELKAVLSDRATDYVAGYFPYPPAKETFKDNIGYHEFHHPKFLPLRFESLSCLHVSLVDNKDQPIQLPEDYETIVWVELKREDVMENQDQFMLTCTSYQPFTYKGNTLTNFHTPLPNEMELSNHEMAMVQLMFPNNLTEKDIVIWLKVNGDEFRWNLSHFTSTTTMLVALKKFFLTFAYKSDLSFHYSRQRKKCSIRRKNPTYATIDPNTPINIQYSREFGMVLGETNYRMQTFKLIGEDSIDFNGHINLNHGRPSPLGILSCDILEASYLGGEKSRMLHCVPIQNEGMFEPEQLLFLPIEKKPFTSIGFQLHNMNGSIKMMTANDPSDPIMITLLIRSRKDTHTFNF